MPPRRCRQPVPGSVWLTRGVPRHGLLARQCDKYVKDKEEISLDEDLATKRQELQASVTQRLQLAADLKQKGNKLLAAGEAEEAMVVYLEVRRAAPSHDAHDGGSSP